MGRAFRLMLFWLAAAWCGNAQQADTGVVIASFEAGGLFGIGAHGSVGGSLAVPQSQHLVPFVDFSYSPLSSYAYTYGVNDTGKALYRSHLIDFNGGLRIRFPNKSDWVPYIGLGAGVLHVASSDNLSGFSTTETINASRNEFAGNASVGALYYVNQHVGFGMEVKGYGAQHNGFVRATAQVFYQFP
ncbi:MAG TPA: hypothetical protein VKR61_05135 [Bryobacteraceae bacterium]|nr:hypothetical protein [Bryobacteraceae bacterium]